MLTKQFKKELHLIAAFLLIVAFVGWDNMNYRKSLFVSASTSSTDASSAMTAGQQLTEEDTSVATPSATPALKFDIDAQAYVYKVFSKDHERAFEIIDCESKWNTNALNDNTTWGGIGQDRGIWQINNVFHPVSDECAYDYKCSTNYAKRMYDNDNQSFTRWTCGK